MHSSHVDDFIEAKPKILQNENLLRRSYDKQWYIEQLKHTERQTHLVIILNIKSISLDKKQMLMFRKQS